jgi:uncharacterized membrane protein (Fun14 family)
VVTQTTLVSVAVILCTEALIHHSRSVGILLAGMFFVGVQLLQKYGYVSSVNWDKLGNDTSTQIQHWAASVDVANVHSIFHTLGIPVNGGLGLGFLAGFVRTR